MKKFISRSTIVFFVLISVVVNANANANANINSFDYCPAKDYKSKYVTAISVDRYGSEYIAFKDSGSLEKWRYLANDTGDYSGRAMLSLLLTAVSKGFPIEYHCNGTYVDSLILDNKTINKLTVKNKGSLAAVANLSQRKS